MHALSLSAPGLAHRLAVVMFVLLSVPVAGCVANDLRRDAASDAITPGVSVHTIASQDGETSREATVFVPRDAAPVDQLPLVVVLDGRAVHWLGPFVQEAIDAGELPPLVLLGVHAAGEPGVRPASPEEDARATEYLVGYGEMVGVGGDAYARHERFVTEDVVKWARDSLPVTGSARTTALMGFSNGASFALLTACRHQDVFGGAVAIALPWQPTLDAIPDDIEQARIILAVGDEDEFSAASCEAAAETLGVDLREFRGGHEWEAARPVLADLIAQSIGAE